MLARLLSVLFLSTVIAGCATTAPMSPTSEELSQAVKPPAVPDVFESEEFIVVMAKPGDNPQSLAARFLGAAGKSWMIEEYNGAASFSPGQQVVIPRRYWKLAGVDPTGYQLVPVLCYHNIAPQAKGRLTIAVKTFEEQMRYLKNEGYRVLNFAEFYEFLSLKRQLPQRAVLLTFDDGYKSFLQYAYPILKEFGFTATLFVYTDYVGTGRNALSWPELKKLAQEGFQIEAHTKSHSDLRRASGESENDYLRRMKAELDQPRSLFERNLGSVPRMLAYPFGAQDDEVARRVRDTGYSAAFTVRRQGNASFVDPFRIHRSQIYSDMSLDDFLRNLTLFSREDLK
ncbi:MAG: polysaccharide deacetylase family protein [Deltaproteobacteria bacterium]|nr:polysaccharide deacetylase family protein [Deltaproteobacteria bacterium]